MAPDKKDLPKHSPRGKKGPQPPTLTKFMQEAEHLRNIALAMLQADGHHAPLVIAWRQDGCQEVIALSLHGSPVSMGTVLKGLVRLHQVHSFVAIAEAWMTRGKAASLEVAPSQSPEREQVLSISAIHPEGRRGWFVPFATEGGRVVLGTPVDSTGMTLGGGIPEALNGQEGRP